MPIAVDELRAAAAQSRVTKFAESITDARRRGVRTAFLCHSHKDAQLAEGLVALLAQHGWRLYVDWRDDEMPERPNRETAERIQARIVECNYFLFLATGSLVRRQRPFVKGIASTVLDRAKPSRRGRPDGLVRGQQRCFAVFEHLHRQ